MKLAKFYSVLPFLFLVLLVISCTGKKETADGNSSNTQVQNVEENIVWKHGVAFINNEPKFIMYDKLDTIDLIISSEYRKTVEGSVVKGGKIGWDISNIIVFDVTKEAPMVEIKDTERILHYMISNSTMYVSEDGLKWGELKIRIVDDKEHFVGKDNSLVYMIIALECDYFKGEYQIFAEGESR